MCPSFVLASLGLEFVFPKWEAGSGLWSASFYQFLADSHKADIPLRWAKRMLKSEVRVPGASGATEITALPALTLSYSQHFPEINKNL